VTNAGRRRVVVDVRRAGFALDLRGRPKVVRLSPGRRVPRLVFRPRSFALAPGASAAIRIASAVPRRAEPGDHAALVLVTTRRRRGGAVAVRMRLGVVVVVRVPGRAVRRLVPLRLHVRRVRGLRLLDLLVANRGNVSERIGAACLLVDLLRRGRPVARLLPEPRELLPRTRGIAQLRYRGRARGAVLARVRVSPSGRCGRRAARRFHLRL
jgi:antitoxin (DNA-binding transcriptional repressor) of toxin-antitoxin stability system